ncbi:MAG TPA: hypothetical protein EYQ60_00240 [Myxococcales bacterium]|nr:hypothetical protein [Myxococcales bacterium]
MSFVKAVCPATDDHSLLGDNLLECVTDDWSLLFAGLTPASYTVSVYAPEHLVVETGEMTLNGVVLPNLPGGIDTLLLGVSYGTIEAPVIDGTLLIASDGVGIGGSCAGLAGVQVQQIPAAVPSLQPVATGILLIALFVTPGLARLRAQRR